MKERIYFLDWLRVGAVFLVLLYHVGMIYNNWGFHIKSSNTTTILEYPMVWMHGWRMPLLFFISGAASVIVVRKRTSGRFIKERALRLYVPLIFSMLVIVPPQIYIERINLYSSFLSFYPTVFEFIPFPMGGSLSWHHLWFILYLFIYTLLAIPLLYAIKGGKLQNLIQRFNLLNKLRLGSLIYFVIIVTTQVILRPYFPEETHSLIDDWAFFTQYFMFFLAGILFAASDLKFNTLIAKRLENLVSGLLSFFFMMFLYYYPWEKLSFLASIPTLDIIWEVNEILCGWLWVLIITGYGAKYFDKKSSFIEKANEGIYPFYILHQTIIIVSGYYILQYIQDVWGGFFIITIASFIISAGIYELIIKRNNFLRFLFGMKPRNKLLKSNTSGKSIISEV